MNWILRSREDAWVLDVRKIQQRVYNWGFGITTIAYFSSRGLSKSRGIIKHHSFLVSGECYVHTTPLHGHLVSPSNPGHMISARATMQWFWHGNHRNGLDRPPILRMPPSLRNASTRSGPHPTPSDILISDGKVVPACDPLHAPCATISKEVER